MQKAEKKYHVYILASDVRGLVKIGKSNNAKRVPSLVKMGYGGAEDWRQVITLSVDSNHAALAVEGMIHARLANQGFRCTRFSWVNRLNNRQSFADECFTCSAEHAVAVGEHMLAVYHSSVS